MESFARLLLIATHKLIYLFPKIPSFHYHRGKGLLQTCGKKSNQHFSHTVFYCVRMLNPFPNKPWFLRVYSTSLLKTLWEKEKLLATSNFSFFHSVLNPFGEFSSIFHHLKLSSENSFNLEESKNCRLGKG